MAARARLFTFAAAVGALIGCAQPTLVECPIPLEACATGCFDFQTDVDNCGACGHACAIGDACQAGQCSGSGSQSGVCAIANGGCSADAACFGSDVGSAQCVCDPDFTGDGVTCAPCTQCAANAFAMVACTPTTDTVCAQCSEACATCAGSPDSCTSCPQGETLQGSSCVAAAICGNAHLDPGEQCDDGNTANGDGCSSTCTIEAGFYCFDGDVDPSQCRAGTCVTDALTAQPGAELTLDGSGAPSAAGFTFSQFSTLVTATDQSYPILVEADVAYADSGEEVVIGSRGDGQPNPDSGNEPVFTLHADLAAAGTALVAGSDTLTSSFGFTPQPGILYHVRYVDDGLTVTVDWVDPTNLAGSIRLVFPSTFHGELDRVFVGGGAGGGLTVSSFRACQANSLPIVNGLVARYSAMESWTVPQESGGLVDSWQDISGNGNDLSVDGSAQPVYGPNQIDGLNGVDFAAGPRMVTEAFELTTDVTVFAVIRHRVPEAFATIVSHGDPSADWSLAQNGNAGSSDDLIWKTDNDSTDEDLTLTENTQYVLMGRINGNARDFSATPLDGTPPLEATVTDAAETITAGVKVLVVGTSQDGQASNAQIGDILYFDRALSDTERDQVIAYLHQLWLQ